MVRTRAPEVAALRGRDLLERVLAGSRHDPVTHVEQVPPRPGGPRTGRTGRLTAGRPLAGPAGSSVRGSTRPQRRLAHAGKSVVIATGTASGKSLAYQLPVLTDAARRRRKRDRALPRADQGARRRPAAIASRSLVLPDIRAAAYDGDTAPSTERDWVRAHSRSC